MKYSDEIYHRVSILKMMPSEIFERHVERLVGEKRRIEFEDDLARCYGREVVGKDGDENDDDNLSLSSIEEQIDDRNKQIASTPKSIRRFQQKESNKQKPRIPLNKPDSLNPLDLCDGIRKMRLRRESANFARQKFAIQK